MQAEIIPSIIGTKCYPFSKTCWIPETVMGMACIWLLRKNHPQILSCAAAILAAKIYLDLKDHASLI